jgi:uncharacterized linocin/CFP29 family protein
MGQAQLSNLKQLGQANNAFQQLVLNGGKIGSLRNNAILRKDEWKEVDKAVVRISRQNLVAIMDLKQFNLTRDLGGLGTTVDAYERTGKMGPAKTDMSGTTSNNAGHLDYDEVSVPVPITHLDFNINIRRLLAARQNGRKLDTTQAEECTESVDRKLEKMVFEGENISVDGAKIFGYANVPGRFTGTKTDWSSTVNIYNDVKAQIFYLQENGFYGPYVLYVSNADFPRLYNYYGDGSGQTVMDRLLKLPGLSKVSLSPGCPDGASILVQMSKKVVDLSVGEDIQTLEWTNNGGLEVIYKVLCAMVPRVKIDKEGKSGICHFA